MNKPASTFDVENNVLDFAIQNISEIDRGDFLVHREHGVGMCAGLSLKNGPNNTSLLHGKRSTLLDFEDL